MTAASGRQKLRQAVGVFHHADRLQQALEDLVVAGVKMSDLSLLGRKDAIGTKLEGRPRMAGDGMIAHLLKGMVDFDGSSDVGAVVCSVGALAGILRQGRAASDRTLHPSFARWLPERLAATLQQKLDDGGLLLWVAMRSSAEEQRIGKILLRHSEANVQIHDMPPTPGRRSSRM